MATITAAAGGGNWNVGSTWVGGVVPLTTDNVVLDATSGQVTITATAQCVNINFTGYTNTITFNANLTITGDLTRSASVFSYAGTGGIIIAGTTTQIITTTSVAWTIPVTFGGASPNISINGAFNITAPLTLSSTTSPVIARANVFDTTQNINASGNITISGNGTYTGSANIVVLGSNNQTLTVSGSHQIRNNLTINKTGGVLSLSGTLNYNTGTLTYVASGGTVDASTSTLNIGASTTLNTNGINWYRISVNAAATITLTSNLNVTNRATYQNGTITHAGGGLLNLTGELSCGSFTASTNVTFPNADLNVTNLLINISALNFNTTVNNGVNNIYISGNYTLANNNNSAWYGITCSPIIFNGSGTQTWTHTTTGTAFVYHVGKVTINTTGTLVFGSNIFWGGNTFQYIQGIVNQNNKSLYIFQSSSLNLQGTTDNLIIENLDTIAQVTGNITLLSDIYCQNANLKYATTFGMSGNFKLTCNNLVVAETTLVSTGTFNVPANNIYVNNLTLNGRTAGGAINCTGGKFYVNGNFNANGGTFENNFAYYGSEIILTGSGNFATTYGISNPITFDTSGTIRITSTYFFFGSNEAGTNNPVRMTLKYLRGNIIADKTILYLARAGVNGASVPQLYELINIHKIVFKEVFIASSRSGVPNDIIMNEFFNGSPTVKTKVQAITAGVNYVVNFKDNFEKIAKFVDVSGCTLLKPQQLLLLTNMKKSSTNTRGIRYNNQSPNGIPKGDSSVQNLQTVGQTINLLVGDPSFVKSI